MLREDWPPTHPSYKTYLHYNHTTRRHTVKRSRYLGSYQCLFFEWRHQHQNYLLLTLESQLLLFVAFGSVYSVCSMRSALQQLRQCVGLVRERVRLDLQNTQHGNTSSLVVNQRQDSLDDGTYSWWIQAPEHPSFEGQTISLHIPRNVTNYRQQHVRNRKRRRSPTFTAAL